MYYAKFDENGIRLTSIVEGIHFHNEEELQPYLLNGFIPITNEEQNLYATNNFIRDKATGNPIERPIIPLTTEQILDRLIKSVQKYMDDTSRQRGYDNIFTLCSYKDDIVNPIFNKEGAAANIWRSLVWTKCYSIRDEVLAGTRTMPADIISELPIFTWGD